MMITDSVDVKLHDSQALIQLINANVTYCAWQRGGGKTGGGIGPRILHLSEVMPRSQILLFSDTYERLMDRIVPNIIGFIQNKLGLVEGVDFVKFKKPPEDWTEPLIPLTKYDKVISFSSGMALCLVSLSVEGSANAFNAQAAIGDEVKFCDEEKIDSEVLPALRGAEEYFGNLPEYLSVWMFSDKYGPKIYWYLKKRKLVNKKAVETVYTLQLEILKLLQQRDNYSSSATKQEYTNKINAYKEKADRIRKHLVYFSDMKPYENLATLGKFFFKRAKRIAKSLYVFNVAYLNHDPDKIEHAFYPSFSKNNKYTLPEGVNDIDLTAPFIGAMDYNYSIAPLPITQISKLPGNKYKTLNFVDYFYELEPKGIEDAIKSFCTKHVNHLNKKIHFIHDHTSISRSGTKVTNIGTVKGAFKACGWKVITHYIGDAPDHDDKFEAIKKWLVKTGDMSICMNQITCDQLIKCIEQTPAITSANVTKKDKRKEKDKNFPQEDAPHGSDAFDQILWGIYEHNIKFNSGDDGLQIKIG
jgi:hypothetical protein